MNEVTQVAHEDEVVVHVGVAGAVVEFFVVVFGGGDEAVEDGDGFTGVVGVEEAAGGFEADKDVEHHETFGDDAVLEEASGEHVPGGVGVIDGNRIVDDGVGAGFAEGDVDGSDVGFGDAGGVVGFGH